MNIERPQTKVSAATLGGAGATLLVWGFRLAGVEVPGEVAAAMATVVAFLSGYLVREP